MKKPDQSQLHSFVPHPNADRYRACVKCARMPDHPIHQAKPIENPLASLFPRDPPRIYGQDR
jgi:hypothetical protein